MEDGTFATPYQADNYLASNALEQLRTLSERNDRMQSEGMVMTVSCTIRRAGFAMKSKSAIAHIGFKASWPAFRLLTEHRSFCREQAMDMVASKPY